ncbi:MAG: DUF6348 family protein [Butyrivibrio sp.]|nr:DUF6348 family protein [Muribaculum sp.]MCM1552803.1 DUF6348 family protein [Butyrivibrio sp.]
MGLFDVFKKKSESDFDLSEPEGIRDYVKQQLAELLKGDSVIDDGGVLFRQWNVRVCPQVSQATDRGVVLDLYIEAPQWGKNLYECTVGMGDDPKTRIGMALSSFVFAFMQGIISMEEKREGIPVMTQFAGREHSWRVYKTDIVGTGRQNGSTDPNVYWDALKDDILKRLGNQKLCYVKVFGSKVGKEITGEVRIDDVKSEELSDKVAKLVAKWDAEGYGFVSQKQFFFIRQEESTLLPYPYDGKDGFGRLKEKVITAAKLFHEATTEELYDTLPQRLGEALQDPVLGYECFFFLPEICTENAFPDAVFPETVDFVHSDGRRETVYKNQLADYALLWQALFTAFDDGVFGEATDDIYKEYISSSATYGCFAQMMEKGSDPKDARGMVLMFPVEDGFVIR